MYNGILIVSVQAVYLHRKLQFNSRPDEGVDRVDGYTVEYTASDMVEAYKIIRAMYKYIAW